MFTAVDRSALELVRRSVIAGRVSHARQWRRARSSCRVTARRFFRLTRSRPICATCGCGWAICTTAGRSTRRCKHVGGQYQNIVLKGDTLKPVRAGACRAAAHDSRAADGGDPACGLAIPDQTTRQSAGFGEGTRPARTWLTTTSSIISRAARILCRIGARAAAGRRRGRHESWRLPIARPARLRFRRCCKTIADATWDAPRDSTPRERSLRRVTQRAALDALMILGAHPQATPEARAVVMSELVRLQKSLAQRDR